MFALIGRVILIGLIIASFSVQAQQSNPKILQYVDKQVIVAFQPGAAASAEPAPAEGAPEQAAAPPKAEGPPAKRQRVTGKAAMDSVLHVVDQRAAMKRPAAKASAARRVPRIRSAAFPDTAYRRPTTTAAIWTWPPLRARFTYITG